MNDIIRQLLMGADGEDSIETPLAPQEIPLRPEDQIEEEPVVVEPVVEREPAVVEPVDTPPVEPKTPQQELLDQIRAIREQQDKNIASGREADASNQLLDSINKAAQQANQAMASGYANIKTKAIDLPKTDFGEQAERDKKTKLQEMLQEYKLLNGGDKKDKQYFNTQDGIVEVDKTTGATRIVREGELRKDRESRLKSKESQRQKEYVSSKIIDLRKSLSKDDRFKQMTKEGLAFDQVDNLTKLAEKGNQTAFGALGTKMARAMGEVGVLTDADVVRYVQGGSLSRKAADTLSRWKQGRPSKASIEDIKQISNVLKDIHSTKMAPIYDEYAKTAYENLPISRAEAYERLSIPLPSSLKKARQFFKKNKKALEKQGITTEKEAEEFLRSKGKL